MAERFQMDPDATRNGLTLVGGTRAGALSGGMPSLPSGTYIGMYSGLVNSTLEALRAGQVVQVEGSQLTAVTSVSAVSITEKVENQPTLQV
ncbi:hypothetical protein P5V34_11485 [Mycobacteroides abscessus subsp. abscessus]|jgi:hypothetical protein|uniref:hypothetical protein n=1 Tax=Mycobacteroides abscessus TaxID=36809 RepID=UPI00266D7E57|nr:hypothetical protein [Mycobacteroides abscessus]MDO3014609.1 hypothetical protein [Mycobacteroides abscessus subsp. abscessus]